MLGNISRLSAVAGLVVAGFQSSNAFPPSPYFTIYGIVRDQVGQRVSADGNTVIVLLKNFEEVSRSPLSGEQLDQSYELNIRLDANRHGTELYREKAYAVNSSYSLAVEIAGVRYYPIEASGDLKVGVGSERLRLDLNLGEDRDGDGLPDVWEEWQLYQAGHFPGADGLWDLTLLSRDGDFDGDGQSDGFEYIAGTFAGDAGETFGLEIKSWAEGAAHFQFYQIVGKVYTLEASVDGQVWQAADFSVASSEASPTYQAPSVGVVSATSPSSNSKTLYRLTVR